MLFKLKIICLLLIFCFGAILIAKPNKLDKKDCTKLDDIAFYVMILNPNLDYKGTDPEYLDSKSSLNLGVMYSTPIYERVKLNIGLEYLQFNYEANSNSKQYKILGFRTNEYEHINVPILLSYYINFRRIFPQIDYVLKGGLNYSYLTSAHIKKVKSIIELPIDDSENDLNKNYQRSMIWFTLAVDFLIPMSNDFSLSIEPRFSSSFINFSNKDFENTQLISQTYYYSLNCGVVYSF